MIRDPKTLWAQPQYRKIMQDILPHLETWLEQGKAFALATVIKTWGSAPRPVGSALAVNTEQEMAGSVSGGCVEGDVAREAQTILREGKPRLLKYGVSNEDAWSVGLSCGGSIHVWLEPFFANSEDGDERDAWEALQRCLHDNRACILATDMRQDQNRHFLILPDGDHVGARPPDGLLQEALRAYRERRHLQAEVDGIPYFIRVYPRKSQLIIVGAAHITADLVQLGNFFGFETIVIDPRGTFAHKTAFEDPPQRLLNAWPAEVLPDLTLDAYAYAVMLTHDPKIDDQALHLLLRTPIGYIGALGSSRTHAKRVQRLEDAGFKAEEIERIHAPIGLDIHAKKPREIALSIMAEIIRVQNAYQ